MQKLMDAQLHMAHKSEYTISDISITTIIYMQQSHQKLTSKLLCKKKAKKNK